MDWIIESDSRPALDRHDMALLYDDPHLAEAMFADKHQAFAAGVDAAWTYDEEKFADVCSLSLK